ncbi:MAG TPA: glycoside hydrolase family 172 protein [Polyangiales bacterium]
MLVTRRAGGTRRRARVSCVAALFVLQLAAEGCQSDLGASGAGSLSAAGDKQRCGPEPQLSYCLPRDAGGDASSAADAGSEQNAAACATSSGATTHDVTLDRLLREMIDLSALTELPHPHYVAGLASSHDRSSDTAQPGDPNWFANHDWAQLKAGTPLVLLDVTGPGVLTRLWSAAPTGVMRIYLDGSSTPTIEADTKALLDGQVEPYAQPFGSTAAAGHTLYFPIPYARSCRVTVTSPSDAHLYYHVSYRAYDPGTRIETLDGDVLSRTACTRHLASQRLSSLRPDTRATDRGDHTTLVLDTADAARSSATIQAGPTGGVLLELRMQPAHLEPAVLRGTILTIRFDGEETVHVPLSDFFAAEVALDAVNSVPIGVSADGVLVSRWPMPFARQAEILLSNTGVGTTEVLTEVVHSDYAWGSRSLHFRAHWHAPDTFPSSPPRDWNLVTMHGEGFFVGNGLNVVNRSIGWWGEGDEKIYVDDDRFPSFFGTGTEDYYGYAWCSNQRFSAAYTGQPHASTRHNFGYTSLYRFQIPDPIPFRNGLRFDQEVQHWGQAVDVTYDGLSLWYTRPGANAEGPDAPATAFRIPVLGVPEPTNVAVAPYQCGS